MTEYDEVRDLADRAGFKKFTPLQEKSFGDENFFDLGKWLFVTGATGAGKTLVALLSYFYELKKHRTQRRDYKMLFAVPYRALATQKTDEISQMTAALGLNLRIVQSTSENNVDDAEIMAGKVDIAIIINEKIFMFASADDSFMSLYDLIVLDEIALIQDPIRGIKTDFILLKAKDFASLRIIALGTPFYGWSEYVGKFDFVELSETTRPIEIKEFPIFYNHDGINYVAKDCRAVQTKNFTVGQFDIVGSRVNDIVTTICKYHLQRNEKIIIFLNNRQQVRDLSRALLNELVDGGSLSAWIDEKHCKGFILNAIQADSEEILYGAMEEGDYRAFAYGICYHNADMPSTLRNFIERDILSDEGHLRIVCSTETLAYGINSNADVVIIPYMEKGDFFVATGKSRKRFLKPNEYMNYAGRAGRLKSSLPLALQKKVGYVYPVLNSNFESSKMFTTDDQKNKWDHLHRKVYEPEIIFSKYLSVKENFWPFYLLSLFPNRLNARREFVTIDAEDLKKRLRNLPLSAELSEEELTNKINRPLNKLLESNLIWAETDAGTDELLDEYSLTEVGSRLSGFVVSFEDFIYILGLAHKYVQSRKFFEVDLLYAVLSAKELLERGTIIVGDFQTERDGKDRLILQRTLLSMKEIFSAAKKETSSELYGAILEDLERHWDLCRKKKYWLFAYSEEFRVQRFLAAILFWRSENCSPIKLYDNFKIYYEQMRRLLEVVNYHLKMIQYALKIAPGSSPEKTLRQELGLERIHEAERWIENVISELDYQPSNELRRLLGIDECDLYKAQKLQRLEKIFSSLLETEERAVVLSNGQRKNFLEQLKKFPKVWREKFRKRFCKLLEMH